jgi:hypothetical protein
MVKAIFADAIVRNLCTYFERAKHPSMETIDMWFNRISKIPDEPVQWIVQRIKETSESFPRNLPNTLWEYYREWIASNPDKVSISKRKDCIRCNGDGYVYATKIHGKNQVYSYVFRCPECEQAKENAIPYWVQHQFSDKGFTPIANQNKPITRKSMQEMIAGIGKELRA